VKFKPCHHCGKQPIVRPTDISLIAVVCITPDCPSVVILANNPAVGKLIWERKQRYAEKHPLTETNVKSDWYKELPCRGKRKEVEVELDE
jgi:hypothetical protein